MRKISISIILSAIVAVCGSVETSFADVGFSEDFDSYTTGSPPGPPWEEHYRGNGVRWGKIDDSVSMSGKSLHFFDQDSSGDAIFLRASDEPMSQVVVEFNMLNADRTRNGIGVGLTGGGGRDHYIAFQANGGIAINDSVGVWDDVILNDRA